MGLLLIVGLIIGFVLGLYAGMILMAMLYVAKASDTRESCLQSVTECQGC